MENRSCVSLLRLAIATFVALPLLLFSTAHAQGVLGYSFETGLRGFGPNGGGTSVTQDTIGATNGSQSMKLSIAETIGLAGALTGEIDPNLGDPPGVEQLSFDLTLTEQFPPDSFVDIYPKFFGSSQPDYPGGQQDGLEISFEYDTTSRIGIGDLGIGTHHIIFELNTAYNPFTTEAGTFNDIFGEVGSGPNDIIPTGFQLTINKATIAPWTGYIDNIRFSSTGSIEGDFDHDGDVDGNDFLVWQRGETDPPLDPADLVLWQDNYGSGGNLTAAIGVVPEPGCAVLLIAGLGSFLALHRRR